MGNQLWLMTRIREEVGTDKYHIKVCHHLRVGKSRLNTIHSLFSNNNHAMIDMFSVCSHLTVGLIACSLFPAQQLHISCHLSNISFVIQGYMSVAGSFIGVTDRVPTLQLHLLFHY